MLCNNISFLVSSYQVLRVQSTRNCRGIDRTIRSTPRAVSSSRARLGTCLIAQDYRFLFAFESMPTASVPTASLRLDYPCCCCEAIASMIFSAFQRCRTGKKLRHRQNRENLARREIALSRKRRLPFLRFSRNNGN